MGLTLKQGLLALGMLITGSINTLSKKAQNNCKVPGYYNASANGAQTIHSFNHPWFQTLIAFIGEMTCFFIYLMIRCKDRRRLQSCINSSMYQEIGDSTSFRFKCSIRNYSIIKFHNSRICHWIFLVPTLFDIFGTSLAGIGLLYVDASVWQMLRGSVIIFAFILSKLFFKRDLLCTHWSGILMATIGLMLVGLSSVLKMGHEDRYHVIIGIFLILAGQLCSAIQMIVEELYIKKDNYPPLQIVGMEGTFGSLLMASVVLPTLYFIPGPQLQGNFENSLDAMYQVAMSPKLLTFCLMYFFSVAFYNFFGLAVTQKLSAIHRTMIDASRTLIVWAFGLIVYYYFDEDFGEPFDKTYGVIQIDGFIIMIIGTLLYNNSIQVPFFSIQDDEPLSDESMVNDFSSDSTVSIQNDSSIEIEVTRTLLTDELYQHYVCH